MRILIFSLITIFISYLIFYIFPLYHGNHNLIFYNDSNKLFAHRILNSNEANKKLESFPGVEIDIYYNKRKITRKCY